MAAVPAGPASRGLNRASRELRESPGPDLAQPGFSAKSVFFFFFVYITACWNAIAFKSLKNPHASKIHDSSF
jgi:hypothetical protein